MPLGMPTLIPMEDVHFKNQNPMDHITLATTNPGPIFSSTEATSQLVEQNETRLVINETIKVKELCSWDFCCFVY